MSAPARGTVLTRLSPVAETAQSSLRTRVRRVRNAGFAIVQTGIAAGLAWFMAKLIVGTPDPFFAPAAAVISVGLQRGQPLRRSAELRSGVAIGIGIAFLLRSAIGLGPVQIGAIVALTILAALLVDGEHRARQPGGDLGGPRDDAAERRARQRAGSFFDALIGGAVALVIGQLAFARNPASSVIEPAATSSVSSPRSSGRRAGAGARRAGACAGRTRLASRARRNDRPALRCARASAGGRRLLADSPPLARRARAVRPGGSPDRLRGA